MADSRNIETLFVSSLYRAQISARGLNAALARTCVAIAAEDKAGQRWSKAHGYKGYTSYASLDDLPQRASVFEELIRHIDKHVRTFGKALDFELGGRALGLDSLWINVMDRGGVHSAHIHPHSAISGTYYVEIPKGAADIRFEDPRLAMMMAAPPRKENARRQNQTFARISPRPGTLLLWESFLRHEVLPNGVPGKRISISFNYAMR
ncbi:MAG TPA: TIGR02466 family protein [Rhizomicrobium sp.]